ncbi:MAG: tetratricopeptide repeat protein [bacterium]
MADDARNVSAGRLLAAGCVALVVTLSALVTVFLSPFWCDNATAPSRLGAIPGDFAEEQIAGDLSRAAQFYGELSRIDPDFRHRQTAAEAEFRLGEYFESTDRARALKHFQVCIDYFEEYLHGWPWFRMGLILVAEGREADADDCFEHTMRIDDGRLALRAGYERGKIAMRRGEPGKAWDFFYEFLRFYSSDITDSYFLNMLGNEEKPVGRGLYVVGRSLLGLGRIDEARSLLQEYILLFPDDHSGRFFAAQAGVEIEEPVLTERSLLQTGPCLSTAVHADNDGVIFYSNGRLIFDVYGTEQIASAHLAILPDKIIEKSDLLLSVTVNEKPVEEFQIPNQPSVQWEPAISLQSGRNIVELSLQCPSIIEHANGPLLRIRWILLSSNGVR